MTTDEKKELADNLEANTMHLLILTNWIGKALPAYKVEGRAWQLNLIVQELDKLDIISAFLEHRNKEVLIIYPSSKAEIRTTVDLLFNSNKVGIPDIKRVNFKQQDIDVDLGG